MHVFPDCNETFFSRLRLYHPQILTGLSGHWSSNEPLSPQIIETLSQSRKHLAGYELCNELYLSAVDLGTYIE